METKFHIEFYKGYRQKAPVKEWIDSLRDNQTVDRVLKRLKRVEEGNFGDCKSVGNGVFELRLDFGKGYRVYFAHSGEKIVLLLCAGDKRSQERDIIKAKGFWDDYKKQQTKH